MEFPAESSDEEATCEIPVGTIITVGAERFRVSTLVPVAPRFEYRNELESVFVFATTITPSCLWRCWVLGVCGYPIVHVVVTMCDVMEKIWQWRRRGLPCEVAPLQHHQSSGHAAYGLHRQFCSFPVFGEPPQNAVNVFESVFALQRLCAMLSPGVCWSVRLRLRTATSAQPDCRTHTRLRWSRQVRLTAAPPVSVRLRVPAVPRALFLITQTAGFQQRSHGTFRAASMS